LEDLREELETANDDLKILKAKLSGLSKQQLMPIKEFDLLASMVQDIKTLSSLGMKKVTESLSESKIESLKTKARKMENEIVELNSKRAEMEAAIEFANDNKSVIEGLQDKMDGLKKYTEAVPIIESLKRAFGNKGIRVTLINQLTNALARRMNAKAHLVFPEPMLFDFQLSDKTCDILVTRNAGTKGELTSDIRVLSQSERKSFSLLLMYCLLPMTPNNSRLNIAVLDEMTSNMDHPTKVKVFREFIPALREVVPHIILADTGNLEIDDAREYTVVKKGNVSKLVESENVYQETK
jgi:DNA repair exonuclease SbcCD ATPase subunit